MQVLENRALRDRVEVFVDRAGAGRELARLVRESGEAPATILAIPAGGVPVAVAMASELGWPLDVAVVSKIVRPWTTEAGFGAVAFDGHVLLNDALVRHCELSEQQVATGIQNTRFKVARRHRRLHGPETLELSGTSVVLVDDGLASGFTMLAAIAACRRAGARRLLLALPTGHTQAVERVASQVDLVICANIRGGSRFAVADAYERWGDVPEAQAELALERHRATHPDRGESLSST